MSSLTLLFKLQENLRCLGWDPGNNYSRRVFIRGIPRSSGISRREFYSHLSLGNAELTSALGEPSHRHRPEALTPLFHPTAHPRRVSGRKSFSTEK